MGRITAALLATASTATLTLALAPAAEAAPHQVKYVISSDRDFLSQTLVLQNEPPSKSAYDTESSKYLVRNSTRIAPDAPFVVETTLNDPTQWAYVSASAAAKAVTGAPSSTARCTWTVRWPRRRMAKLPSPAHCGSGNSLALGGENSYAPAILTTEGVTAAHLGATIG